MLPLQQESHKTINFRSRKREFAQKDIPLTEQSNEPRPQRVQNKPAQGDRIITQNLCVRGVVIRVTQHSHADKETPTQTPTEVSRTNARNQMKIEAFSKNSNRQKNDSSPTTNWKKPIAMPPTQEMKPTNLIS